MTMLRVACVQMCSGIDPEQNIAAFETGVRQAADSGARYVQTPEMSGLVQRKRQALFEVVSKQRDDRLVARAAELARELSICLHVGSTAILRDDGKVANRAFLFADDGEIMATYDKIHMFDVDLDHGERWRESAIYEPGGQAVLADLDLACINHTLTDTVKLGLSICYDLRFPALANVLAHGGADILTYPACFTRQTGKAHWHALLRSRAIENGCFVIAAAQGGDHQDGRSTFGHSLIVNPWGEVLGECSGETPGVVVADLNIEDVAAARAKVPNLANERDFVLERV